MHAMAYLKETIYYYLRLSVCRRLGLRSQGRSLDKGTLLYGGLGRFGFAPARILQILDQTSH